MFINSNVAPLNVDQSEIDTYEIKAEIDEKHRMCSKMIPRFVLDNFENAISAIDYIRKYVTVYFPKSLLKMNYQIHYLIGDCENTYALEFINGKVVHTRVNQITNFNVANVRYKCSNKVYTPTDVMYDEENKPTIKNRIEKYGAGLERWNIIIDNYHYAKSLEGMRCLLQQLYYSRTYVGTKHYPSLPWHSEFAHEKNDLWLKDGMPESDDPEYIITVDSKPSEYIKIEEIAGKLFETKERGKTNAWITVHSCVYDLFSKTLFIRTQEEEDEYIFKLNED